MKHDCHAGQGPGERRESVASGALVIALHHAATGPGSRFTRADVVVTRVDHAGCSYEVRLFLNNPGAGLTTPRDETHGYAGRFHVFGHGGCFGDAGHCDVTSHAEDPTDLRPPHPLTPLTTYVTVTRSLRRLMDAGEDLVHLSMVPISLPPVRADSRYAPELFRHDSVDLRTYFTPQDAHSD